jgi:hypothetical protein
VRIAKHIFTINTINILIIGRIMAGIKYDSTKQSNLYIRKFITTLNNQFYTYVRPYKTAQGPITEYARAHIHTETNETKPWALNNNKIKKVQTRQSLRHNNN